MLETILLAFLFAKIKKLDIKPIFKTWHIYPIVVLEIISIIGQVMIFNENYQMLRIVSFLKTIYLTSYLFLVFKYEIYNIALIGSACVFGGGILNDVAIKANGGVMPVFPSFSYITGYVKPESFNVVKDIHVLGSSASKFKILTDYIDLGYSILSVGDVFIRVFVFLVIFYSIKKSNDKYLEVNI